MCADAPDSVSFVDDDIDIPVDNEKTKFRSAPPMMYRRHNDIMQLCFKNDE